MICGAVRNSKDNRLPSNESSGGLAIEELGMAFDELVIDERELATNAIKQGFLGRSDYPKGTEGPANAIRNRPEYTRNLAPELIGPPGLNPYKKVSMFEQWAKIIPEEFRDITCPKPTKRKKESRDEIKKEKKEQQKKIRKTVDKIAR